jgi:hypothetical protein
MLGRGQGAKGPEAALGRHGLQRGGEARCREVQGGAQEAGAQAARAQHRRRLCSKDALERGLVLRTFIGQNVLVRRGTHAKGRLCRGACEEGCGGAAHEKK